jgi:hypothetical protein
VEQFRVTKKFFDKDFKPLDDSLNQEVEVFALDHITAGSEATVLLHENGFFKENIRTIFGNQTIKVEKLVDGAYVEITSKKAEEKPAPKTKKKK